MLLECGRTFKKGGLVEGLLVIRGVKGIVESCPLHFHLLPSWNEQLCFIMSFPPRWAALPQAQKQLDKSNME
jgi:hypothetical protein